MNKFLNLLGNNFILILAMIWIVSALGVYGYSYQISPFNPRNQEKTFKQVAQLLNVTINPALLPPRIFKGSKITNEYNDSVWGFSVGDKRSPIFDFVNNAIILHDSAKIHSLAHEYTHYFQYNYLGYKDIMDNGGDTTDFTEWQAIQIQNEFR